MATKAAWQKEREAKEKQKQWETQQQNDHKDWQQKRADMINKKEVAEQKAREAEQNAPEFLKKLGNMKEKAANKPKKTESEGPTIEKLDNGTDIPPWHRPNAPEKPEWVVLLLLAAEKEAQEEEEDVLVVSGDGNRSLKLDNLRSEHNDWPEWKKHAKNLKSASDLFDTKGTRPNRRKSLNSSDPQVQAWQDTTPNADKRGVSESTSPRRTPKFASKSASADLVTGDNKPEWMKGAEKLRKKRKPIPNQVAPATPAAAEQPEWMTHRSKIQQQKSKDETVPELAAKDHQLPNQSTSTIAPGEEQPAWMVQRSKIQPKAKEESSSDEAFVKKSPAEPQSAATSDQPEWMIQRSRIKQKTQTEGDDTSSDSSTAPEKPAQHLSSAGDPPAWMVQRSKIKQQAQGDTATTFKQAETTPSACEDDDINIGDHNTPPWMKNVRKPRISVHELRSSVVQEKLERREPIRAGSIRPTKEELTTNKVKEKLAQRPSLVGKKALVKTEEMEWMKTKLKPRPADDFGKPNPKNDDVVNDDGKPAWMKHKLKPRVSPDDLQTSTVQEKLQSKEPMRESSLRNISKEELTTNIVQEKLHSREPMQESSLRRISKKELTTNVVQEKLQNRTPIKESSLRNISKEELTCNIVKEKLAQRRASLLDTRTPTKTEEMEVLKPNHYSRDSTSKPTVAENTDNRPEWMAEAHIRVSPKRILDTWNSESESDATPMRTISRAQQADVPDEADQSPEWMQEPHRRMPSKRIFHTSNGEDGPSGQTGKEKDDIPKEDKEEHRRISSTRILDPGGGEKADDIPKQDVPPEKMPEVHILDRDTDEDAADKTESDNGIDERRDEQFLGPGSNGEKADHKPRIDTRPMKVQPSPILVPSSSDNADNQSQPDMRPEKMKEARKRKSSRKSISLSDNEKDETGKDNPVSKEAMTHSKTMDERVENKTEWWRESAHALLVAKGLLPSADPVRLKLKVDNVAKPVPSTTRRGRATSRGRSHKAASDGINRRQAETQKDAAAKEWAGTSPVDIMTPKKTGTVDDQFWASFSMTDDTDVLSSDPGDKSPAQTPADDGRFWSSLVYLGKEGSQRSFASGLSDEQPATHNQFTASMNGIAAVLKSAKEHVAATGSSNSRSKSISSKERSKSRSRPGSERQSRSGSIRPKKIKEKEKEEDKEKKSSKKDKKVKGSSTAKESVIRRKSPKMDKKEEKKEKKKREMNDVKA